MPTRLVRIAAGVLPAIETHARREYPAECCGLLVGTGSRIAAAHPARNALASESRYLVDPADHFRALRRARQMQLAVIGAYHSHPRPPAAPSPRDLAEAAGDDFLYLIVAPAPEGSWDVGLFLMERGNFVRLALVIEDEEPE